MSRLVALVISLLVALPTFGQLVSKEQVLSAPISVSGLRASPAAVWTGDSFAIFWSDGTGMYGGHVGAQGTLTGPAVKLSSDEAVGGVAFNGSELLLVTWAFRGGKLLILARVLSPDLATIFNAQTIGEGFAPRVAWNGTRFVAAWTTNVAHPWIVVATLANDATIVANRLLPSSIAPRPRTVALASTETETLLVWEDSVGCEVPTSFPCLSRGRVLAARLDANLGILDLAGIAIAEEGYNPDVVAKGREYLVVWSDLSALHAQRIDAAGLRAGNETMLDPLDEASSLHVSAASDGRGYFMVTDANAGASAGIFGARLDAAGAITIHLQQNFYEGPVVFAGSPSLYLIAYQRYDERRDFRTFMRVVDLAAPARRRAAR